jgi:imidazolonepropionase
MKLRLHADEFEDSGAAELAGRLKAHSADHLMAISEKGIQALASNNVIATMLPGTTIYLGKQGFAPAQAMRKAGCRVAIASDYNPGSSVFNCQ